jgi:hypothetical protein
MLRIAIQRCGYHTARYIFPALGRLPSARNIGVGVLAALVEQVLLQGNTQVARELAEFPGMQQSPAACVQQLLQLSARLDMYTTNDLLQLPGAQAMVSTMN